jgi:hypothetical protein
MNSEPDQTDLPEADVLDRVLDKGIVVETSEEYKDVGFDLTTSQINILVATASSK